MAASRVVRLLALAFALGACRPDVEGSVPCPEGGDFACPSGYHCEDGEGQRRCVPGENPPKLRVLSPDDGAAVSGEVDVAFSASSPLGLTGWEALVLGSDASMTDRLVPLTAEWADATRQVGTFRGRFDARLLEPGSYVVVFSVRGDGADFPISEARVDIVVRHDG